MHGYVCIAMHVGLCMYVCMYGYACRAMHVGLCMYGYALGLSIEGRNHRYPVTDDYSNSSEAKR